MRISQAFCIVSALSAAAFGTGSQAEAHAYLKAATPAAGSSVSSPKRIVLTMSEKVFPKFSGFQVMSKVGSVPVKVVTSNDQMVGILAKPLQPGTYEVQWHAVGSDTHRTENKFSFSVQ